MIDTIHQRQCSRANGFGLVVHAAAADIQQLGLASNRELVVAVGHRFSLSNPALVSASSKKSFSSVSSPILTCKVFTSNGGLLAFERSYGHFGLEFR